jgi:hypothetical protein
MTMAVTNSTIVTIQERPKNRGSIFSIPQESKRALGSTETYSMDTGVCFP